MTRKITNLSHEQWLDARRGGIGGSDAGVLLGFDKNRTTIDLWRDKTGRSEPVEFSPAVQKIIDYGKNAESHLIALFALDNPEYEVAPGGTDILLHEDYDFIRGTLDGALINKETGARGILEIKTCQIRKRTDWDDWDGRVPNRYLAQVLHCMSLRKDFEFAILKAQLKYTMADGEIRTQARQYFFDRKLYQGQINAIVAREKDWWARYVIEEVEPPVVLPKI